jgi:membrane-associated phospholipid phosphatase
VNQSSPITIRDRLGAQLPFKLLLVLLLYPAVYGPYQFLQRHHFFPPTELLPGLVDSRIPFDDRFTWIYLSIYLLMPIGPVLMNTRRQLFPYAAGIILITVLADVVFLFHPTLCPRPNSIEAGPLYRLLIKIDNPFHGFPSLHAAFAIYSGFCAAKLLRMFDRSVYLIAIVWIWVTLILYSTLATKQHTFVDIAAGSALGMTAYFTVFYARLTSNQKPLPASVESEPQTIRPIA